MRDLQVPDRLWRESYPDHVGMESVVGKNKREIVENGAHGGTVPLLGQPEGDPARDGISTSITQARGPYLRLVALAFPFHEGQRDFQDEDPLAAIVHELEFEVAVLQSLVTVADPFSSTFHNNAWP